MSSENVCFPPTEPSKEEQIIPDDLFSEKNEQHLRKCSDLEAGCGSTGRHLKLATTSHSLSVYYYILHFLCILLGVSLFYTTTTTSKAHLDLTMLGA